MTTRSAPGISWARSLRVERSDLGSRIALLFMVGSFLFALGSLPAYVARVDARLSAGTFFIGSIFFTAAALGQFDQQIDRTTSGRRDWRGTARSTLWWSAAVQLIGTFLFNISTGRAANTSLDDHDINRLVWAPDMFGSVAFLVASHLAWIVVCRGWWAVRRDDEDWWISAINYLGSIFFMVSAIASLILPTTGEVLNITLVNLATFLGSGGFFVGAYLLLPARSAT